MTQIAIIGSGPAGLFALDALIRKRPQARIDVIDRLPTPFGLVRGGVAPDHQGTKNITRQFERHFEKPNVRFLGNVTVGRDLSYDEIKAAYDLVFLAIGAPEDRRLGIPGDDAVLGSGAFVGWYNGHPDHAGLNPKLGPRVAVIGVGNVALDVARVLAKTPAEMAASDLCVHARAAIAAAGVREIHVLGRRGPEAASFTPVELAEFGRLEAAVPVVHGALPPPEPDAGPERARVEKNLEALRGFAALPDKPVRIHFRFNAKPIAIEGRELILETPERSTLAVDAVVSCIGYRTVGFAGLPMQDGVVANHDGMVEPGVFALGWARRGPSGTIPTNRADSIAMVDRALATLAEGKPGGGAIDPLLAARHVRVVGFAGWKKINAAEIARARPGAPREKFIHLDEMLAAADA